VKGLIRGFSFAFKGLGHLLGNPSLWGWSALPVVLNIALFIGGIWAYIHFFPDLLGMIMDKPDIWYMWIVYVLLIILLVVAFALVVIFGFTAVGCIIAAPFLDLLSEKVEKQLGRVEEGGGFRQALGDMGKGLLTGLVTVVFFILSQLILLLLWFLPVIGGIAYAVMAPLVGGFFLAYEFHDFPLGRRHLTARQRFSYVMARLSETLGFGLAIFLTTMVPLVNFLYLPAATVGATLLVRDQEEREGETPAAG